MAPEMIHGGSTPKADIYSYGIVLWEIFCGEGKQEPYEDLRLGIFLLNAITKENVRPTIPKSCPGELALLMTKCWAPNPKSRPGWDAIIRDLELFAKPDAEYQKEDEVEEMCVATVASEIDAVDHATEQIQKGEGVKMD